MPVRRIWPTMLLVLALAPCACKSKSPTSAASSAKPAAGSPAAGKLAVLGGKLKITATDVGAPTTLNAWIFGPLGTSKGADLGVASAVGADGSYSFPSL